MERVETKIPLAELSISQENIDYNSPSLADHLPMKVLFGKRPKIIGSYRLGRTLGRGAYCKVKSATHIVTKEKFAIKILKPTQPKNWIEVEREIEILRQIQHPNIIRVHEVLYSDNGVNTLKFGGQTDLKTTAILIYIIMELAEGGELWEYVYTHGAIDEEFARKLFRQIVSGLDYCHMHLICHRDLKLENILLDEHDNIKINDFGLSNFIKPGHSMHTFCGTLSYAAPELLMHQAYSGPAVDVWSLGVILYTMLVGDLPWNLDKPEIQQKELQLLAAGKFRIPLVYGISESCIMLLKMMLQPQAKQRATLEQVRQHPWVIKGYTGPPPRVMESYPPVREIDDGVLQQVALLGLNFNKAKKSILANEAGAALCLYQTLLRKKIQTTPTSSPALTLPQIRSSPLRPRSFDPRQGVPALGLDDEQPLASSTSVPDLARTRSTSDPATSQDEIQLPASPIAQSPRQSPRQSPSSSRNSSPPKSPKSPAPKSPLRLEPLPVRQSQNTEFLSRSCEMPVKSPSEANREPFLNKIARLFGNKEA